MEPSREQFFALLRGDTTTDEINAKRAYREHARRVGRRQNEIEAVLDALPLDEFMAFQRRYGEPWDKLLAKAGMDGDLVIPAEERNARKLAYAKVWRRRVETRYIRRKAPGGEERRERARAARGQGKSKNR